ncbi:MAG: hypothetical protein WBJ30_06690, partial [Tepidanaerobacteraceae bacterium]
MKLFSYRSVAVMNTFFHETELLWKRFLGFAFYQQGKDPVVPMKFRKCFDLLANPLGVGRP